VKVDRRAGAITIALLALVVTAGALRNGFALDDVHIIADNARVHTLDSFWRLFGQTYWPPEQGASLYRPLTMLAFAVQWVIGDGSPLVFHVFSSILFAATCVAFYFLAEELTTPTVALVAGALFAVHPVHVEVFANVVGQAELWVALLVFVATLQFVRARKRGDLRAFDIASISGLYIAACMFKEHAIVLPAILGAVDVLFVGKSEHVSERTRKLVPIVGALVITAVVFVVIRSVVAGGFRAGGTNELFRGQSFTARLLTMLTVIVEWVRLFFWPADLSADYSFPRTRIATEFSADMLPGVLVLIGLAVVGWRVRKTNPVVTFALAWIVITLAIPSNLFIVTGFVLAERTLFLASAGVLMLVAMGMVALWEHANEAGQPARIAAACGIALVLGAGVLRSIDRAPVWRDNDTLFAQTVQDVPSSSRAHWMLAEQIARSQGPRASVDEMLLAVRLGQQDDPILLGFAADQLSMAGMCPRAMQFYLRALNLTPQNVQLRVNASLCLLRLGRSEEARAVAEAGPPESNADPRIARMISLSDSLSRMRVARAN
jgi:hypothetical protein